MIAASFRRLALAVVVLSLATGAACADDPLGPEEEALADARARWEATGFTSYTYTYRMACFCPPQILETALVSVSEGQVTGVYLVDSATPASPETFDLYHTIDGLFDRLDANLAQEPVQFEVTYHREAGYPTSADVDISRQIADEEYSFTASDLVAVMP